MHGAAPDLLLDPNGVRCTDAEEENFISRITRSSLLRGCNVYHTSSVLSLRSILEASRRSWRPPILDRIFRDGLIATSRL